MEGKSRYRLTILALSAVFFLVCGTWYLARTSAPEPWQVSTARRPPAEYLSPDASDTQKDLRPDSLLPGEVININTADVYDLQRLPGIGEKRARDIIAYREENGLFSAVDELANVSGIGPAILENLREYASAGDE